MSEKMPLNALQQFRLARELEKLVAIKEQELATLRISTNVAKVIQTDTGEAWCVIEQHGAAQHRRLYVKDPAASAGSRWMPNRTRYTESIKDAYIFDTPVEAATHRVGTTEVVELLSKYISEKNIKQSEG